MSKWVLRESLPMFKDYPELNYEEACNLLHKLQEGLEAKNVFGFKQTKQRIMLYAAEIACRFTELSPLWFEIYKTMHETIIGIQREEIFVYLNVSIPEMFFKLSHGRLQSRTFPVLLDFCGRIIQTCFKLILLEQEHSSKKQRSQLISELKIYLSYLGLFLSHVKLARGNLEMSFEDLENPKVRMMPKLISVECALIEEVEPLSMDGIEKLKSLMCSNVCFCIYLTGDRVEEHRFYMVFLETGGDLCIVCLDSKAGDSLCFYGSEKLLQSLTCYKRGSVQVCKENCSTCKTLTRYRKILECLLRYLQTPKSAFNVSSSNKKAPACRPEFADMIKCVDQYVFEGRKQNYLKDQTLTVNSGCGIAKCPHVRAPHIVQSKNGKVFLRSGCVVHKELYSGYKNMSRIK